MDVTAKCGASPVGTRQPGPHFNSWICEMSCQLPSSHHGHTGCILQQQDNS